ncbi:hypothetical protein D8674_038268 [Pyrus ussuriensis x Pyrus communis]|uniref:DUF4283 domain-containing protein n=1 Tax=Pyrus ussuriensis x Pyrus communis TaxID=2448454 RepID=A0A5N5I2I1_9ROSA|nr:hypothetical protein D8674_038268 [Pyrus ussuriensis x Pyrus communis]
MFGQYLDAHLIKWKLSLLWKNEVKNTFNLDHFGRRWFVLEFTDEDDLHYVLENRLWVPMQYKEDNMFKDISQPIGMIIKMDNRFPLKRVLLISRHEDNPILISYETLFEICFYYGRRRIKGHLCQKVEDRCFMIDRVFHDELLIYPEVTQVNEDIKSNLHKDAMLCFLFVVNVEEENMEIEELGQRVEDNA